MRGMIKIVAYGQGREKDQDRGLGGGEGGGLGLGLHLGPRNAKAANQRKKDHDRDHIPKKENTDQERPHFLLHQKRIKNLQLNMCPGVWSNPIPLTKSQRRS